MARLFPLQGQWTEADYLGLPDTNHLIELSNGMLVVPDMPSYSHQFAVGELFALLRQFVRERNLGFVCVAPLRIRLWAGKFREPDIVFMSHANADRRGQEFWGVPDLAVEVVCPRTQHSSGTERTDRREKFEEYARAGVFEYWLIDPTDKTIEVYSLHDGAYRLRGRWDETQVASSHLLEGFSVSGSLLFAVEA